MNLNGLEYYYVRNAQGDIIQLLNQSGAPVASYIYDSWGKLISIKDGSGNDITNSPSYTGYKNPYRYRGYRYDTETGLYYLQSRYYSPEWDRFINADDISILSADDELLGNNLFAYCTNDPVNNSDDSGYWKLPNWAKVAIGVAAIGIGVAVTAATGGAAAPVLIASLKIAAVSAASSAAINVASNRISSGSWSGSAQAAWNGAADGFMWGGVTSGAAAVGAAAKGIKIKEIGKLKPSNKDTGYYGVKYQAKKPNGKYTTKSFELHTHNHKGYNPHWQQNTWSPYDNSISAKAKRWSWWGRRIE